ncbi:base excision dna repair [Fusarium heterosporum]|uniref:Base excision dna repair n=1 Tax=Fusarium heterosporum TaxID=42747 RepID=A0A8H5TW87_FUSHE|nr:base excision dna repair [Fusarium heterosporum]
MLLRTRKISGSSPSPPLTKTPARESRSRKPTSKPRNLGSKSERVSEKGDKSALEAGKLLADKKWQSWSQHATSSPYPDFGRPTYRECAEAHRLLKELHGAEVEQEFKDVNTPKTIPFVLDAMIVATLSQATSWSNAKRAMDSMKKKYGSVFAYDEIMSGGLQKLQNTISCGGLHVRKSKIIFSILQQVQERHGSWDLNYLFQERSEEVMKELMIYKYIGPKSAFVVMGWCLKRNIFTVDTHVYRIAGLWGWRPPAAMEAKVGSSAK